MVPTAVPTQNDHSDDLPDSGQSTMLAGGDGMEVHGGASKNSSRAVSAAATVPSAFAPSASQTGDSFGQKSRENFVDDGMPLSALFGSAPFNESDILPPSILQNMNFWMNDSLLTTNALTAIPGPANGVAQGSGPNSALGAAQLSSSLSASAAASNSTDTPASVPVPATVPSSAPQQFSPSYAAAQNQQQSQGFGDLNSFIPMDLALGLSALDSQFNVAANSSFTGNSGTSSALAAYSPMTNIAALQTGSASSASSALGFQPDFLQQLNPLRQAQVGNAAALGTPSYSNSTIHSPLTISSPNPLLASSSDVGQMMSFPTTAFESLNLVSSLDLQTSSQNSRMLQGTLAGNNIASLLSNSAVPQVPIGITNGSVSVAAAAAASASASASSALPVTASSLSRMMQPVPDVLRPAATLDSAMLSFQQNSALGSAVQDNMPPRHNSIPLPQGRQSSFSTVSSEENHLLSSFLSPSAIGSRVNNDILTVGVSSKFAKSAAMLAASQSMSSNVADSRSASFAPTVFALTSQPTSNLGITLPSSGGSIDNLSFASSFLSASPNSSSATASAIPAPFTSILCNSSRPRQQKESSTSLSPAGTPNNASVVSIGQMNNAIIPQILKDAVHEHPELGTAELLYNLLITHVVHDFSRTGIYQARIFWLRAQQYSLPMFYLFASIADACRSWTLSDELRAALPPNLDEICYALAIEHAPKDDSDLQIVTAIGLMVLAFYEFKSARFAPMVEHNCLSYKIIVQAKFRGVPFPWRAAKKRLDSSGVDSNYQAVLRAFWRICMSLYYATEIFRLDAPEDRDFLPEMPERDDYFVRRIFAPDSNEEYGFKTVDPPYEVSVNELGDLTNIISELYIKQYKIANRFNRVQRGEKAGAWYINYLLEWDRQMLEWRDNLPAYLHCDLAALGRQTQPLDARRRRMNLWGLSEDEMWQKRHQWNQDVGHTMEVLYVHMVFETARIKAHRIGLMLLMRENLDMVRNFQNSKAFTVQELPPMPHLPPVTTSHEDDAEYFRRFAEEAKNSASHLYEMLKFSYQFGLDLHAYTTIIISILLQVGLVYVGQVQSTDAQLAWRAMLRLARILGMIRSLDRWAPALYIFTNILKALGRPDLVLHMPSPETRAQLLADTRKPAVATDRSVSVDSNATAESGMCMDICCAVPAGPPAAVSADSFSGNTASTPVGEEEGSNLSGGGSLKGKRKNNSIDVHGDEKRYEFSDHHHGDPHTVSSIASSPISEEEDVANPFPPEHVITHIMREQKVSTATFFSPTLPILAASLLHNNSST
ncbi:hypothetical protein GGI25_000277 [Coemansia spiralis]|uniref:Transcription factor domain-containing protein n=1 Tax=Coemansia spiralis TaxID=417178 RepID=A0A9W8G7W5_9FUNG|nr:hypothetical protein GGI25_000277 [Coemansia spiralis]